VLKRFEPYGDVKVAWNHGGSEPPGSRKSLPDARQNSANTENAGSVTDAFINANIISPRGMAT